MSIKTSNRFFGRREKSQSHDMVTIPAQTLDAHHAAYFHLNGGFGIFPLPPELKLPQTVGQANHHPLAALWTMYPFSPGYISHLFHPPFKPPHQTTKLRSARYTWSNQVHPTPRIRPHFEPPTLQSVPTAGTDSYDIMEYGRIYLTPRLSKTP